MADTKDYPSNRYVRTVVGRIAYKDWEFRTTFSSTGTGWIEATIPVINSETGEPATFSPITMPLLMRADDNWERSIVNGVFEFCQRLELHELNELFTYRGKRIYEPHRKLGT